MRASQLCESIHDALVPLTFCSKECGERGGKRVVRVPSYELLQSSADALRKPRLHQTGGGYLSRTEVFVGAT